MDFEEGACKQVSRKDLTEGTVIPSIFNTFFFFFLHLWVAGAMVSCIQVDHLWELVLDSITGPGL